ncbi:MAG: hypothetical protein ABIJ92_02060 [Candidatus Aenigmatarchaeota archaeon]
MDRDKFLAKYPIMLDLPGGTTDDVAEALMDKVVAMDERVEWILDNFPKSEFLRRVLLNDGCYFDGDDPQTMMGVLGPTWLRKETMMHLAFLQGAREIARGSISLIDTSPSTLVTPVVMSEGLIIDLNSAGTFYTERPDVAEILQDGWMKNHRVRQLVGEYESALLEALYEFDKKDVLSVWRKGVNSFIYSIDGEMDDEIALQQELKTEYNSKGADVLDLAYYAIAKVMMRRCTEPWDRLYSDDYGSLFVVDANEKKYALTEFMRPFFQLGLEE